MKYITMNILAAAAFCSGYHNRFINKKKKLWVLMAFFAHYLFRLIKAYTPAEQFQYFWNIVFLLCIGKTVLSYMNQYNYVHIYFPGSHLPMLLLDWEPICSDTHIVSCISILLWHLRNAGFGWTARGQISFSGFKEQSQTKPFRKTRLQSWETCKLLTILLSSSCFLLCF